MAYDYDRTDAPLRKKIIRLAYENPELRDHLLPLVMKEQTRPINARSAFEWQLQGITSGSLVFVIQGGPGWQEGHVDQRTAIKDLSTMLKHLSLNGVALGRPRMSGGKAHVPITFDVATIEDALERAGITV